MSAWYLGSGRQRECVSAVALGRGEQGLGQDRGQLGRFAPRRFVGRPAGSSLSSNLICARIIRSYWVVSLCTSTLGCM